MMDYPSVSSHLDPEVRERFHRALILLEGDPLSSEAVSLLRSNAERGCADSMVLLGDVYADGDEAQRKESICLFRSAAEAGDPSGMRNLAYCHAVGLNCEKDKAAAAELYEKSAEMGNPRAMCNIGVMYDYGNGVDEDPLKAFQWYLRSAEAGCQRGMTNAGECYMRGRGTEKDLAEAERWLSRSGSPRALCRLAEIYMDEMDDMGKGMEYLRKSAGGGYSKAMVRLAITIERSDRAEAVRLYSEAARKGNKDAIARLESMGEPVPESSMGKGRKKS
ncbi:MAG: sel1 repeat family protein [Candidatus Methanomethylophilaceae archaeon]|nr:sel1 repeat family protein [Candidatus Methanomethylophilaceae archaeon]